MTETELLPPIPPAPSYEILVTEADLGPEANVPVHKHSGPETWFLLTGEQCLEMPGRVVRARLGETMSAPPETPMRLNIVAQLAGVANVPGLLAVSRQSDDRQAF